MNRHPDNHGKDCHMNLKETADAMSAFHMALLRIDETRGIFRTTDLASADHTWSERREEILHGLDLAWLGKDGEDPPATSNIALVGAHLLALYVAAVRAEQAGAEGEGTT